MSTTMRRRRSWPVTGTALLMGVLGVISLVRAARRLQEAQLYAGAGLVMPFSAPLDALLSVLWGAGLLGAGWGLWRVRPWAYRVTLVMLPAYTGFSFVWLARFVRSDYDAGRLPFLALVEGVGLALWALLFTCRRVREAFTRPATGGLDDRSHRSRPQN